MNWEKELEKLVNKHWSGLELKATDNNKMMVNLTMVGFNGLVKEINALVSKEISEIIGEDDPVPEIDNYPEIDYETRMDRNMLKEQQRKLAKKKGWDI